MSKLGYLVDPLREMLQEWGPFLRSHADVYGLKILCLPCDIVPQELPAAWGFMPLRIPSHFGKKTAGGWYFDQEEIERALAGLDPAFVVPAGGCGLWGTEGGPPGRGIFRLSVPPGYDEEAALSIHEELTGLAGELTGRDPGDFPKEKLADSVREYDVLKRLVRGIVSIRSEKPGLLSQEDLQSVMEGALCLPPGAVVEHLALVLRHLNEEQPEETARLPRVMAVGDFLGDGTVLDHIEEGGFIVAEDDSCLGRRQFDMSYSADSAGLYEEIIFALRFRPLCPALRTAGERFDLLYRQLGNQGIDLVVFIEDIMGPRGREQMEYLRVRLMRAGIDPLVVDTGSAREKAERYRWETGDRPLH